MDFGDGVPHKLFCPAVLKGRRYKIPPPPLSLEVVAVSLSPGEAFFCGGEKKGIMEVPTWCEAGESQQLLLSLGDLGDRRSAQDY